MGNNLEQRRQKRLEWAKGVIAGGNITGTDKKTAIIVFITRIALKYYQREFF